ncbi:MAG: MBL fold metallo-hydrolase [Planctomycetota bacterium]
MPPRKTTTVTFIGASTCIPDLGAEASSLLVNESCLIDLGWNAAMRARDMGYDPLLIDTVILTHLHQDHYMGLVPFLFYRALTTQKKPAGPLTIIGPSAVRRIADAALDFLQARRFSELEFDYNLVPLPPGAGFETDAFRLDTCPAKHVSGANMLEEALALRLTDLSTGAAFAYSGDTSYHPPIADLARSLPLLIHDSSHTSPEEAATIARDAASARLILIHYRKADGDKFLAQARRIFPETSLAVEGATVDVPPRKP